MAVHGRRRTPRCCSRSRRSRRPSRSASSTCSPCCSVDVWGLSLGLATAIAGAAAFNFFHIPPTGASRSRTPRTGSRSASTSSRRRRVERGRGRAVARPRGRAAPPRGRPRGGAGRVLLGAEPSRRCATPPAHRARRSGCRPPRSCCGAATGDERRVAIPLARDARGRHAGVPVDVSSRAGALREHVAPALEALLGRGARARRAPGARSSRPRRCGARRAQDRDAARRCRHDLRSPLTAIVDRRRGARGPRSSSDEERAELAARSVAEAERLRGCREAARPLAAAGRRRRAAAGWCSLEEVISAAAESRWRRSA